FIDSFRPRLERDVLQIGRDVDQVLEPRHLPDAGEIRLAVRLPRRRRREVGLAVRQARNTGRRVVEPLRGYDHTQRETTRHSPQPPHRPPPHYWVIWRLGDLVIG